MNFEIVNEKKIRGEIILLGEKNQVFDKISQPHHQTQWLGNTVRKTSKGFDVEIDLPLYQIQISATILRISKPDVFEFLWNSEYVMSKSVVTFRLTKQNENIRMEIEEVGEFDQSRWSEPQKIHLDIWKKALERLKNYATQ